MKKSVIAGVIFLIAFPGGAFAHVGISDSPTTACDSIDSLDLATHATNQIIDRLNQSLSTTGLSLFSNRVLSSGDAPWTRNPDAWIMKGTPLDFAGLAGYNSSDYTAHRLGTLISPRHFIGASHYHPAVGEVLGFIDADGNRVERTVVGGKTIGSTDIFVGILDNDVPDSITYYPIIASSTLKTMLEKFSAQTYDVPIVVLDQEAKVLVRKLFSISSTYVSHSTYTAGTKSNFSETIISGDSGNPGFILIDNQPILLFAHHTANAGPNYGNYISEINSAMTALGGEYQVTEYNPTCFTKYTLNHTPTFTEGAYSLIIHHGDALPAALSTYTATDEDIEQTISYSLVKLYDKTASADLIPSDFFVIHPSTGVLTRTSEFDVSLVGHSLELNIKAEDNGENVASTTYMTTLDYRDVLNQTDKIILDPNFTRPTVSAPSLSGIAFDTDGKLVVVGGFTSINGVAQNGITRLNADGSSDTAFQSAIGSGLENSGLAASGRRILIDSDGGMIVAGNQTTYDGTTVGRLAKIDANGVLDPMFASNAGIGLSAGTVNGLALVGDKILAVGLLISYNGTPISRIAAINSDGSINTDFYTNYKSMLGIPNAVYYDGEYIYVGGSFISITSADGSTTPVGRLARFSSDGILDTTFNTALGVGFDGQIRDIKVRPDGKIVVVGDFLIFNDQTDIHYVALLNSDGTLDQTFASNVSSLIGQNLFSVVVQSDNKITVGGNPFNLKGFDGARGMARLNADGTSDDTYNTAMGDGLQGGVIKLVQRSDGAIAAIGNLNSYDGVELNNSIAIFMPLEEVETDTETEATTTTATVTISSSGSTAGGGGGGGGGGSSSTYSNTTQTLPLIGTSTSAVIQEAILPGCAKGNLFNTLNGTRCPSSNGTVLSAFVTPDTAPSASKLGGVFNRSMSVGISGNDIKALQQYLNSRGYFVALSGMGAPGNESTYFGPKTRSALAKFQKDVSISPSLGFFGPITKSYILSH